jgi:hypothetical protein
VAVWRGGDIICGYHYILFQHRRWSLSHNLTPYFVIHLFPLLCVDLNDPCLDRLDLFGLVLWQDELKFERRGIIEDGDISIVWAAAGFKDTELLISP